MTTQTEHCKHNRHVTALVISISYISVDRTFFKVSNSDIKYAVCNICLTKVLESTKWIISTCVLFTNTDFLEAKKKKSPRNAAAHPTKDKLISEKLIKSTTMEDQKFWIVENARLWLLKCESDLADPLWDSKNLHLQANVIYLYLIFQSQFHS